MEKFGVALVESPYSSVHKAQTDDLKVTAFL